MIKLKEIINKMPKYFYHLTPTMNMNDIMKNGLKPNSKNKPWIYLTDDIYTAENYGNMYANLYGDGVKVTLLKINSTGLNDKKLGPDDDDLQDILQQNGDDRYWSDVDWKESLKILSQVTYEGIILPRFIEIIDEWET